MNKQHGKSAQYAPLPVSACPSCSDSFVLHVNRGFGPIVAYVVASILFTVCIILATRLPPAATWYASVFLAMNIFTIPAIMGVAQVALPAGFSIVVLVIAAVATTTLYISHIANVSFFRVIGRGFLSDYEFLSETVMVLLLWGIVAWYYYCQRRTSGDAPPAK